MDQYTEAHLYTAAIRILEHQFHGAASLEKICSLLEVSDEEVQRVARKLSENNILSLHTDPFSTYLTIDDHLAIEELSKEEDNNSSLAKDIEQFMAKKEDMDSKVREIQEELEQKKKNMFSELEDQLKKQMNNFDSK